jgi:hypothetical protein
VLLAQIHELGVTFSLGTGRSRQVGDLRSHCAFDGIQTIELLWNAMFGNSSVSIETGENISQKL